MTPYEEVYGQQLPSSVSYLSGTSKVEVMETLLHNRQFILVELKDN